MVFPREVKGRVARFIASLGAAGAFALSAPPAEASPEDLFGYGARTSAMGATGTAHASGAESAWHNPALASTSRANELTLGYGGAVFRLDATGSGLPGRVSLPPAHGFFIGSAIPVPLGGVFTDRVGVALAFYTPSNVIVRGRVLYPEKTQFPILPDRAQSLTVRAALGVDVGYGVRLGAGFAALAEIAGTVVAATDATGRAGTRVEDQLVATYAPIFGVTYDLPKPTKLRVGLAFRGTLDARFAVVVDGSKLSSITIPLFNISGLAQYDPAQVALEIARISDHGVVALQGVFKRWGSFPGVLEPTVVCSEGGPGACGLVPPAIPWRDTFVIRAGGERGFPLASGLVVRVRGGGFFERSPLPSEVPSSEAFDVSSKGVVAVPTRYFDADRIAFTAGGGVALGKPLPPITLDLYGQYHVLLPRTIRSSDGTNVTLSEGEASGHVVVFGMTAGVKF